jgi:hypothetical protein
MLILGNDNVMLIFSYLNHAEIGEMYPVSKCMNGFEACTILWESIS